MIKLFNNLKINNIRKFAIEETNLNISVDSDGYIRIMINEYLNNNQIWKQALEVPEIEMENMKERIKKYQTIFNQTIGFIRVRGFFSEVDYYSDMTNMYSTPILEMARGDRVIKVNEKIHGSIPKSWERVFDVLFEAGNDFRRVSAISNRIQEAFNLRQCQIDEIKEKLKKKNYINIDI